MDEGEGYLLARVLSALFRGRPSCAIGVSLLIMLIVIGAMLLQAESLDDVLFPVMALAFILVVALG